MVLVPKKHWSFRILAVVAAAAVLIFQEFQTVWIQNLLYSSSSNSISLRVTGEVLAAKITLSTGIRSCFL
jgi:hypothetical protein